MGNMINVGP